MLTLISVEIPLFGHHLDGLLERLHGDLNIILGVHARHDAAGPARDVHATAMVERVVP